MKQIKKIAQTIISAFKRGNKLLIIGNGGSAAQAQHMAAELIGIYKHKRKALPALALTTDTSVITSIANDSQFSNVFSRQIEALGEEGDILLIISTSGKSINCEFSKDIAGAKNMEIIELPRIGENTPKIQEFQLKIIHEICEIVEEAHLYL